MDISDWELPDPALIVKPESDADWDNLIGRYLGTYNDMPLERCISIAREHGASTVVVETRYADPDYRSEYYAFYSRLHASLPPYAHRLHFFTKTLDNDLAELPPDHGYIGYVSIRPISSGSVSRAMLVPPPGLTGIRCQVHEVIGFFGQALTVTGVPFSQQDARLGACAHVAAWVCHFTAHLRGLVARRPRADFALHADPSLAPSRVLPTSGLTVQQLSDLMRRFDLPPSFYSVGNLPSPSLHWQPSDPVQIPNQPPGQWDTRITPVMCRHLNGGYPILVGNLSHAWVVIGWNRDETNRSKITFVRHDDQRGPYLPVEDPNNDTGIYPDGEPFDYRYWRTLQVPLPPKLWLAPESAEKKAGEILESLSNVLAPHLASHDIAIVESINDLIGAGRFTLRTFAIPSEQYKRMLPDLGFSAEHVEGYRNARLPKLIWVVEAIDRLARDMSLGSPCVIGEALLDSTSSDSEPDIVAYRIHGIQVIQRTNGSARGPLIGSNALTISAGRGTP